MTTWSCGAIYEFYCCRTKYHNWEAENNTLIISVSVSQEFWHKSSGSLLWVSQGCSPGVDLDAFSLGGLTGDESTSKLHAITGKIFFQLCDWLKDLALLTIGWAPPSHPTSCHSSLPCGILHRQFTTQLLTSLRPASEYSTSGRTLISVSGISPWLSQAHPG